MENLLFLGIGIAVIFIILFIIFMISGTSKKGMEKQLTKYMEVAVNAQNNIINNNEEKLKNISNKTADINKDAIKTTAHAIKEGLTEDDIIYCKHCGAVIDADSKFCKSCGKEQ